MSTTDEILGSRHNYFSLSEPVEGVSRNDAFYTLTDTSTKPPTIEIKRRGTGTLGWTAAMDVSVGSLENGVYTNSRGSNAESSYFNTEAGKNEIKAMSRLASRKDLSENTNPRFNPGGPVSGDEASKIVDSKVGVLDNVALTSPNTITRTSSFTEGRQRIVRDQIYAQTIARKRYGHYCYPVTLRRTQQDRLKISVFEFKAKGINTRKDSWGTPGRDVGIRNIIGSTILPVPGGVTDNQLVQWGSNELNAAQIATADLAMDTFNAGNPLQGLAGSVSDKINKISDDPTVRDAIKQYFVGQATGVRNILSRTAGAIINPNVELLFERPQLRPFAFNFRVSPRDEEESTEILKIIRMFKQSMAAQTTASKLFLRAPNTYKLQFLTSGGGEQQHKYLPKIKECALLNFSVNYTPDGNYATYENSSMVAYELSFAFQELEPVYNNDYGNLDGDELVDTIQGIEGLVGPSR